MFEVIPGILEKEWAEIERKIELVRPFAKTIHIDIIDGRFAKNTTWLNAAAFKKYTSEFFFELHMMVEEPINYLKEWANVGFKRFLGHIEKMSNQEEFVAKGQLLGEVGLALDGPTSLEQIKVALEELDTILIFTGEAVGKSGQTFLPERLEKIKRISSQTDIPIEVDGGINQQSINQAQSAGATRFAVTSFLFQSQNPKEPYQVLLNQLQSC